jgi:hypothetical protein
MTSTKRDGLDNLLSNLFGESLNLRVGEPLELGGRINGVKYTIHRFSSPLEVNRPVAVGL